MTTWTDAERWLRDRAFGSLDADPESLFEHDGGPAGARADVICARLIGIDDQIEDDTLRLSIVEPTLYRAIHQRLRVTDSGPDQLFGMALRTARYELQTGFVRMSLTPATVLPPPGVRAGPPDFAYSALFVRYRRRL